MKKQVVISFFISALFVASCMTAPEYSTPKGDNIVPKDSLEAIIYDVHLADALITSKVMKTKDSRVDSLIYLSIFEKHKYSREDFENTILYYIHNDMDTLNAIYDRVIARFSYDKGNIY